MIRMATGGGLGGGAQWPLCIIPFTDISEKWIDLSVTSLTHRFYTSVQKGENLFIRYVSVLLSEMCYKLSLPIYAIYPNVQA